MDAFQRVFSGRQSIPLKGFLSFTPLTPAKQHYLATVYMLLAGTVFATAAGVYCTFNFFELPSIFAIIAQIACTIFVVSTSSREGLKAKDAPKRLAALFAGNFCLGVLLSHIIAHANYIHPSLVPTAFLSTLAVFASFSLAAMFARERQYLYLGSILGSGLAYLSLGSLLNLFFRSRMFHSVSLYAGLLIYVGYVLYDTQAILHEHSMGNTDSILHALVFYVDIVGIFVRLLRIISEKKEEEQQKRHR